MKYVSSAAYFYRPAWVCWPAWPKDIFNIFCSSLPLMLLTTDLGSEQAGTLATFLQSTDLVKLDRGQFGRCCCCCSSNSPREYTWLSCDKNNQDQGIPGCSSFLVLAPCGCCAEGNGRRKPSSLAAGGTAEPLNDKAVCLAVLLHGMHQTVNGT